MNQSLAADVQRAEFAPLGEEFCAQLGSGVQGYRFVRRGRKAHDRAVKIHVGQVNLSGMRMTVDEERVSKLPVVMRGKRTGSASKSVFMELHDSSEEFAYFQKLALPVYHSLHGTSIRIV